MYHSAPTGNTSFPLIGCPSAPAPVNIASVLARHLHEFDYALKPDWDGRGAQAVSRGVMRLSESVIGCYADGADPSDVTPGRDGSLSFVWEDGPNYVYIDIGPNDTLHLYYDVAGQPKWEGVSVAQDEEILRRFANALGFARPAVASSVVATLTLDRIPHHSRLLLAAYY